MTRCPTINFQPSIISQCLAKHISTKVSFKIANRKDMFTLTLVELEYETSVSIWEFEMMIVQNYIFAFISARKRLSSQNTIETEFINEQSKINLFMNICNSDWHNRIFDLT